MSYSFDTPNKIDKSAINVKINSLLDNGRKEISSLKQLATYPPGTLISYLNTNGLFRLAGFLLQTHSNSFSFVTPDFTKRFRINFKFVSRLFVGSVYHCSNDLVSIIPTSKSETNFPVSIGDVIVFYAQTTYTKKRYQATEKFIRAVKWHEFFSH
jgi:hypothetical protein